MTTTAAPAPMSLLGLLPDPELPFLSIVDLGIVRLVEVDGDVVRVTVTPTYSGCPAMDAIKADIERTLADHGYRAEIATSVSPPWTTDDLSPRARDLLAAHGFAPPQPEDGVRCPRCDSESRVVSRFGSTACKALMVCCSCGEPFDLFKEHR